MTTNNQTIDKHDVLTASKTPTDIELKPRVTKFDLSEPLAIDWHSNDPYRTAMWNALSIPLPAGEKMFVDSVRHHMNELEDDALIAHAKGFIQQESMHRKAHENYNETLCKQRGYVLEELETPVKKLIQYVHDNYSPKYRLACTVCMEHMTAILSDVTLRDERWLNGAHADMKSFWNWHAVEEIEHKSVAYDIFLALGGNPILLKSVMKILLPMTINNLIDISEQMLRADGKLTQGMSDWLENTEELSGDNGIFVALRAALNEFFDRGFHPWNEDNRHLFPSEQSITQSKRKLA